MLYLQYNTLTLLLLWLFVSSTYANDEFARTRLNPTDVTFLLYSRDNSYTEVSPESVDASLVEKGVKTYFVIDGLYSNRTTLMAKTVTDDLITLPNSNVIMVDWAPLSGYLAFRPSMNDLELRGLYNKVTTYVPAIAQKIVNLIESLKTKKSIPLSQVHVIGFSLGAQIGAVVGSEIRKKDKEEVGRISGLDPASFNYQEENVTADNRLDVTDAAFVDIYHTNRMLFGNNRVNIGHANFYINGGLTQPLCANETSFYLKSLCDHRFSWKIWNLAFKNDIKGCPCKVEAAENDSICTNLTTTSCASPVRIGLFLSTKTVGNFFVGYKNTTGLVA